MTFFEELRQQRWDDHRFYHRSRINQSLHFFSALSFLFVYAIAFSDPVKAALIGWFVSMWSRQIGHFFFEPKSYDDVNHASHDHKEDIKVGYNLKRKVVLKIIWALSPVLLILQPSFFGLFQPAANLQEFVNNVAIFWLYLAVAAVLFRVFQLWVIKKNPQTGIVWATKILTDPINDLKMYNKSVGYLMRGQLIDPMIHTIEEEPNERLA